MRFSEFKIKEQLCDIGRRIWQKGFCAGNEGNHSFRMGPNKFFVTPTGVSKGNLKPDDICTVDGNGKQLAGKLKRSSEFLMHAAIYKARPDVNAVIHSHPPHATAFAVAGVDLPTCIHPEAEVFLGPVKTAKYVTPGDNRLGESMLPYVKDSNTILMGNHGVVCFHPNLEYAYYQLEIVDAYAKILLLAKQLGTVNTLKERFGMTDPRAEEVKKGAVSCVASDFLSRVGGETGSRGRMITAGGAGPVPAASELRPTTAVQNDPLAAAIHSLAPQQINESEIEQLVQVITDQIMATAG
jgi:L-fuculose-phosphate aldolase